MPWAEIIALAIKYAPQLIAGIIAEFQKTNPTPEDWHKVFGDAIAANEAFIAKEKAALREPKEPLRA